MREFVVTARYVTLAFLLFFTYSTVEAAHTIWLAHRWGVEIVIGIASKTLALSFGGILFGLVLLYVLQERPQDAGAK